MFFDEQQPRPIRRTTGPSQCPHRRELGWPGLLRSSAFQDMTTQLWRRCLRFR